MCEDEGQVEDVVRGSRWRVIDIGSEFSAVPDDALHTASSPPHIQSPLRQTWPTVGLHRACRLEIYARDKDGPLELKEGMTQSHAVLGQQANSTRPVEPRGPLSHVTLSSCTRSAISRPESRLLSAVLDYAPSRIGPQRRHNTPPSCASVS